jgi:hypothetical protein
MIPVTPGLEASRRVAGDPDGIGGVRLGLMRYWCGSGDPRLTVHSRPSLSNWAPNHWAARGELAGRAVKYLSQNAGPSSRERALKDHRPHRSFAGTESAQARVPGNATAYGEQADCSP